VDIYKDIELFDCPRCHGTALLEENSGRSFYVMCLDCGCQTADIEFKTEQERIEAAGTAARLWNMGKTVSSNPGE